MRNFILFIRRFFNLILFIALEVVCVILIARTKTLQGTDIASSANTVSGLLYQKQSDVLYYFGLRNMNDSLINENARLRTQLAVYKSYDTLKDSLVSKQLNPGDTTKRIVRIADYVYHTARVVNNSVTAANNYITIDRGTSNGVKKGMGVVSGTGLVGHVINTTAHYASVLSILSVKQNVSGKLKDGTNGIVLWEGDRPDVLMMKDVPQQIKVKPGDTVYTTGYSFYFPPDIMIGKVFKAETVKKNNLQLLYLHPSSNFRNLEYVYVVENKMINERKQLEDSVKNKQ